jgi:hypothetical protein
MAKLIAFCGYGREGKDTAAARLLVNGWSKVAFGDIIKAQLDPLIQEHLGFSAFTENDIRKDKIRGVLEQWGESNYDGVMNEFFSRLKPMSVNTRLVRAREAREWCSRGGIIVRVRRPNTGPRTNWEQERIDELYSTGLVTHEVVNDSTPEVLWDQVDSIAGAL